MKLTAFYPSYDLGSEPAVLRDYAQAAEGAGYDRIAMGEHVLGADPDRPGGRRGPYTYEHEWPAPFPTLAYLATVTERVELMTSVVILPQRQAVLVAKQAAEVDLLSGGRFILGVGIGWNRVEYEALDENFHNRGRRMEEQVALMRALWSEPMISFEGRWHRVTKAGINPLPPGRSIPIWMGGMAEPVIERTGRLADGWLPQYRDPADLAAGVERVHEAARAAGRDPEAIGIQCGAGIASADSAQQALERARQFEQAGATHLSASTMGAGFDSPQQHIDAIRAFAEAYRNG